MNIQEARETVAAAWCQPSTSNTIMDPVLAEEFAKILLNSVHDNVNAEVEQWRACVKALEEEIAHGEKYAYEEINVWHNTADALQDIVDYERSCKNELQQILRMLRDSTKPLLYTAPELIHGTALAGAVYQITKEALDRIQ